MSFLSSGPPTVDVQRADCPDIRARDSVGIPGVQFDKEHPLDWQTLNATRGLCGLLKCYFPLRLSEHEAGQACLTRGA